MAKGWIKVILWLIWIAILYGGYWLWQWVKIPEHLPIKEVQITLTDSPKPAKNSQSPEEEIVLFHHVSPNELQARVMPYTAMGLLWIDLASVKANLLKLSWVEEVVIHRIWPNQLQIMVTEHEPLALWGKNKVLCVRGHLFVPKDIPEGLPRFAGPEDKIEEMIALWSFLQPGLTQLGHGLSELRLNSRGTWEIRLIEGPTIVLGHQEVETRWEQFLAVFPQLKNAASLDHVDLRYRHGMAVSWR